MIEHFRNSPKMPGRDHRLTENRQTQWRLPGRRPGRVEKNKRLSLPVGGLDWCHAGRWRQEAGFLLMPNGLCHALQLLVIAMATQCLSVFDWADRAELRSFTFFLSHFQPLTSIDLLNPDLFFKTPLPFPACIVHWSHALQLPPSSADWTT